ncbi:DUF4832 domain-containing protein [Escherichia coli]|nr:DUF4832 domain-containing protein [Escherichia coli]
MKHQWMTAIFCLVCPLSSMAAITTVMPTALTGPLTNPGMGVASFHQGYGEKLPLTEYPDTGIEYERFYWRDLEPEEGKYHFARVDDAFKYAAAHRPAMNVGLRFMALAEPGSGSRIPDWLIKKGIKGTWTADRKSFIPDLADPLFITYSQRLLEALGQRYDGNDNLAFVDIGMVGSWGEWHNSNFPELKPLLERNTTEELDRFVNMHFSAFPKTPKVMLISGGNSLVNAVRKGAGWRADCWGDLRMFSSTWNHMADDYPQRLEAAQRAYPGFNDAWKRAPVNLEICGYMAQWQRDQHYTREEVQRIFDWALAHHASTLNLKSRVIPGEYRQIVDNALTKIGYRFRLVSLSHESVGQRGTALTLNSRWVNEGVAPIYLPYTLSFRLVDASGKPVASGESKEDLLRWLPGEYTVDFLLDMPRTMPGGSYFIEVAIVDKSGAPRIRLANEGQQSSNWYRISKVTVLSSTQ